MTTQIQCTSAELPNLMPLLATLTDFTLNVIPAAITTAAQAAQAVVQPPPAFAPQHPQVHTPIDAPAAPAPVAAVERTSTMSSAEVMDLYGYASTGAVHDLMKRAEIPVVQRGRTHHYDRSAVLALKKQLDETLNLSDAAELVGYKTPAGLLMHIGQRRITPTMVAGHMRFRLQDLEQFEKLRGPVRRRW